MVIWIYGHGRFSFPLNRWHCKIMRCQMNDTFTLFALAHFLNGGFLGTPFRNSIQVEGCRLFWGFFISDHLQPRTWLLKFHGSERPPAILKVLLSPSLSSSGVIRSRGGVLFDLQLAFSWLPAISTRYFRHVWGLAAKKRASFAWRKFEQKIAQWTG